MAGWRVVSVSSRAKLELKMNYLVVRNDSCTKRVFLDEISVLVIENTGCALTASLLEALSQKKINVIFCDAHHNPISQLVPLYAHFEANAHIYSQLQWTDSIKGDVWAEIIRMKIEKQADNIRIVSPDVADRLLAYIPDIQSGDTTNREGIAAKVYFNALFNHDFSRSDECFENAVLNYGYSVLLSCINRQIVASGYLTQLGIFHHNTFNHFNLGCDLMEPFRPIIDHALLGLPEAEELTSDIKHSLLDVLNTSVKIDQCTTTLLNAIQIYVRSVLDALDAQDVSLIKRYSYEF